MSEWLEDALTPGTTVAGYRIESVLGRGGFAITYRAVKLGLGLRVALKEYYPHALARREAGVSLRAVSPAFAVGLQEFLREGQRLAQVRHRHVVGVVDFVEAHGTAYLALVDEGDDTLQRLHDAGRRWDEAGLQRIARELLEALVALHQPLAQAGGGGRSRGFCIVT